VHVAQEIPTYEQITPQWIKVGTKEQQIPLFSHEYGSNYMPKGPIEINQYRM